MFPAHWLFQGTLQREKLEQLSQMICTVKTARFIIAVIGLIYIIVKECQSGSKDKPSLALTT